MHTKSVWKNPISLIIAAGGLLWGSFFFYSCTSLKNVVNLPFDVSQLQRINHHINPEQAAELTNRYSRTRGSWSKKTMPASEAFNKREVDSLLNQQGCVGIRIRYGMDEQGQVRMVLYGINEQGKDIAEMNGNELKTDLAQNRKQKGSDQQFFDPPIILENGQRCPQYCP
jgi:hypothetical protein